MAGLSLKVLLELQKKGFDKGIKDVEKSLSSLKRTVVGLASAFVGGLGLNQLFSSLKTTATEMSQVENTLKNVSDSVYDYETSLRFLKNAANTFGVEQNALIGSFAKFSAAAKSANVSIEQQRQIFQSLTRAAGAFHLSADQTSNMMLAVEQMMSKGVVASEELRRQLGNVLPGAFQIMANAAYEAGITADRSSATLMEAMKNGEVVASRVMPFFARELNKVTAGASFDSLVSSLNRLQNAWNNFVKSSEFTNFYKGLVDKGVSALDKLGSNFDKIKSNVINFGLALATAIGGNKVWQAALDGFKEFQRATESTTKKLARLKTNLEILKSKQELVNNLVKEGGRSTSMTLSSEEAALAGINAKQQARLEQLDAFGGKNHRIMMNAEDAAKVLTVQEGKLNEAIAETEKLAQEAGNTAAAATNKAKKALVGMGTVLKSLKGVWNTVWPIAVATAVLTIFNKIVGKIKEAVKHSKELKSLANDGVKDAQTLSEETEKEYSALRANVKVFEDINLSERARLNAINAINMALGKEESEMFTLASSADDVKKAVESWISANKKTIIDQQMFDELDRTLGRIADIEAELKKLDEVKDQTEVVNDAWAGSMTVLTDEARAARKQIKSLTGEMDALIQRRNQLTAAGAGKNPKENPSGTGLFLSEDDKAVQKALDDYIAAKKKLENQEKNGAITSKEFSKALVDEQKKTMSVISTYDNLDKSIGRLKDSYSAVFNEIKAGYKTITSGGGGGGGDKDPIVEAFDKYKEEKRAIDNLFKNGIIDEATQKEKTLALIEDLENVVGAQDDIEGSLKKLKGGYLELWNAIRAGKAPLQEYIKLHEQEEEADKKRLEQIEEDEERMEKYIEAMEDAAKKEPGSIKQRDTTFDYKKTQNDVDKENLNIIKDYIKSWEDYIDVLEKIQEEYGDLGDEAAEALDKAKANLELALKAGTSAEATAGVSEIIEDLTDLKKEVLEGYWDRFTTIVDGFQSVAGALENCKSAFERLDEKEADFFDGLKAGFSVIETLLTLFETVNNAIQVYSATSDAFHKLQEANQRREIMSNAAVAASAEAAAAAKTKGAARSVAASAAETAAAQGTASAEATSAAAKAASSVANIPYIGPILAVAAIASVVGALLAGFAKFAKGGIVGGAKTQGDQNVVRANSGEMILNKSQQANLFRMINNGGSGGKVEFELRGDRLVGAINNYNSRKRG